MRFNQAIDVASVLNASISSAGDNNMTNAIQVVAVNPANDSVTTVKGRAFVGGKSYGPTIDSVNVGDFVLETWVTLNGAGNLEAADIGGFTPGLGFPGTESGTGFAGDDVPAHLAFTGDPHGADGHRSV